MWCSKEVLPLISLQSQTADIYDLLWSREPKEERVLSDSSRTKQKYVELAASANDNKQKKDKKPPKKQTVPQSDHQKGENKEKTQNI